ncbi:MAG: hypothetical protein AABW88_03030 [Nanoarchaeota archaeon]
MQKSLVYVLIFSFLATAAFATDVNVGIYVLNLGKFDISTGSFTADFYVSLTCKEECPPQKFEFMNGRAISRDIDKVIDQPNEKFYRIFANLVSPVDLKRFPFDTQHMQIILEDKLSTIENISYVPAIKESGIDPSIIFPGWQIHGWNATVTEHHYPVYNETYSQYAFTVTISRIALNSFLKTFLPVIFIVLIVMFSFLIDLDKIPVRLGIVGSSLIGAVMFHVSITNQIPAVSYLTFADKFMLLSYIIILYAFILNAVLLELQERGKGELAQRIHSVTEYSAFYAVPFIYVAFFLLFI